jgi:hypothetical protein
VTERESGVARLPRLPKPFGDDLAQAIAVIVSHVRSTGRVLKFRAR